MFGGAKKIFSEFLMYPDWNSIPSPCYVLDEQRLRKNLELIKSVSEKAEVEIILAFKGFSMWGVFPIVLEYVKGATASSLNEARLCNEYMKTKAHSYCPVIVPAEASELFNLSSHVVFNS